MLFISARIRNSYLATPFSLDIVVLDAIVGVFENLMW